MILRKSDEAMASSVSIVATSMVNEVICIFLWVGIVVQWLDYLAVMQEPGVRFPTSESGI